MESNRRRRQEGIPIELGIGGVGRTDGPRLHLHGGGGGGSSSRGGGEGGRGRREAWIWRGGGGVFSAVLVLACWVGSGRVGPGPFRSVPRGERPRPEGERARPCLALPWELPPLDSVPFPCEDLFTIQLNFYTL